MAFKELITEDESPITRARLALLTSISVDQGQGQSEGIEGRAENRAWLETAGLANKVKDGIDIRLAEKYSDTPDLQQRTDFDINAVRVTIVEPMSAQKDRAKGVENIVAEFQKREPTQVKIANPWGNGYTIDCGEEFGVRVFFYPQFNKTYMSDPAGDKSGVSAVEVMGGARVEIKQPDGHWRRSKNSHTVRSALNYISVAAKTPEGKK